MDKQKKTKLKRDLSPLNAFALSFGCMIGGGVFVMSESRFLKGSGPLGTALGMVISGILILIIAVNYHYLLNCYPREGGAFTYTRELFGKDHAFVCSWFLSLSYILCILLNASMLTMILQALFGKLFHFGLHYHFAGYEVYLSEVLFTEGILILLGILSRRSIRFTGIMQTAMAGVLLVILLILAVAVTQSKAVRPDCLLPLFSPHGSVLWQILSVIMIAPWVFVGFETITQTTEEFWFPSHKALSIMAGSIILGTFVCIFLCIVAASAVPDGFESWYSYMQQAAGKSGVQSLPLFDAACRIMGNGGLILVSIAAFAAIVSAIVGFYIAASRLLFAMTGNGMLTGWFSALGKYHTPEHAVLFIMCILLAAPFGGRGVLEWFISLSSLGAAVGYAYTSACAYRQAGREGCKTVRFTGFFGVCISVLFMLLLLIPNTKLFHPMNKEAFLLLAVWVTLGFLWYWKFFRSWK